jgi:putative ABC transport system substrate-binding protein
MAAAGLPAAAQPATPARVGMLLLIPAPVLTDPFFAEMERRGWVRGRNLETETRVTAPAQPQAAEMARELVARNARVLVTVGTANAVAARQATRTVPIVMLGSGYPVEAGLAASLARPGGNVTGLSVYAGSEIFGKYVALLRELVPSLREAGVFWGYAPPAFPQVEADLALGEMRKAAEATGLRLRVWLNRSETELASSITEAAATPIQALFVTAGGPQSMPTGIARIADFCTRRRLPAMCDVTSVYFQSGGVLAYSAVLSELGRRGAEYVDRILRGAKPGELPIEQPTRFELVVNLKFARAAGIAVPQSILLRADRVVE